MIFLLELMMFRKSLPLLAASGVLIALSGCATIVEGTSQSVLVKTEPAEAKCEVSKNGSVLAVANPTPASVVLSKSKDDLQVNCQKTGYRNADGKLTSSFQAMTLGNILLGGVVGAVIDQGSGAANQYEPEILVFLNPEKFNSEQQRDEFYLRRSMFIREETKKKLDKIKAECPSSTPDNCQSKIDEMNKATDERLNQLEVEKASATIAAVS
ncbi:hypothetical protein ACFSM5_06845 [Lacibacterium aquatile]|uniref:PEGA domain-containing protein n=1 Tax=Lacibacterium aquatile TaxID=1168082 RepID=A0ABW5DQ62_9PROT